MSASQNICVTVPENSLYSAGNQFGYARNQFVVLLETYNKHPFLRDFLEYNQFNLKFDCGKFLCNIPNGWAEIAFGDDGFIGVYDDTGACRLTISKYETFYVHRMFHISTKIEGKCVYAQIICAGDRTLEMPGFSEDGFDIYSDSVAFVYNRAKEYLDINYSEWKNPLSYWKRGACNED